MQYTRLLGKYASELKYEDLPAEVIEQAKKITLHTIAVAIASMTFPIAPMMHVLYSSPKVSFFRKNLQASGNSVRSCLQSLSYSFVC